MYINAIKPAEFRNHMRAYLDEAACTEGPILILGPKDKENSVVISEKTWKRIHGEEQPVTPQCKEGDLLSLEDL